VSRWLLDGFFVARIERSFTKIRFPHNLRSTSKTFESELQEIAWLYNKGASLALVFLHFLNMYMD